MCSLGQFKIRILGLILSLLIQTSFSSVRNFHDFGELEDLLNAGDLFSSVMSRSPKKFNDQTNDSLVDLLKFQLDDEETLNKVYKNYKKESQNTLKHGKRQVELFRRNLVKIASHNFLAKSGSSLYEQGINQFTDEKYESYPISSLIEITVNSFTPEAWFLKTRAGRHFNYGNDDYLDWRQAGIVTTPKNQGRCGSCTFFASVAALEAHYNLVKLFSDKKQRSIQWSKQYEYEIDLSEQELLDCARNYSGYQGCYNNLPTTALEYMKQHGLAKEWDYPYRDKVGENCLSKWTNTRVKLESYYQVLPANDEQALQKAVKDFGPVITWMRMSQELKMYKRGIYDEPCVDPNGISHNIFRDHLVLIVGYGSQLINGEKKEYWIAKNSYGDWWGEGGYFRISRNKKLCLIGEESYFLYSSHSSRKMGKWFLID